jgi:hypothetical protein
MKTTTHRRWLLGLGLAGIAGSLLFISAPLQAAAGTARVLINADICTYFKDTASAPMQYYNSGIHNLAPAQPPYSSTDVSCAIPFTVPYTSPVTPNPAPFQVRIAGNDGDSTGGVPPICNVEVKDSSWNTLFFMGDARPDDPNTTFGPWVITLSDFAPGLPTDTHTVHCTVPANSDLYAISAGLTL